jgi:hypothetical protein
MNKRFMLDVDKEQLARAPGFDKDTWPDMANPEWARGDSRLLRSPHVFDLALQAGVSLVAWVAVRGKEGCDTPVSWRLSSPEEMSGLAMESTAVPCAA